MTQQAAITAVEDPQDRESLRLLSLFYLIKSGLEFAIAAVWLLVLVFFGGLAGVAAKASHNPAPLAFLVVLVPVLFILVILVPLAFLDLIAARSLKRSRRYTLCTAAAILACLSFPLGTILGVFTFVVMSKSSVKARFRR